MNEPLRLRLLIIALGVLGGFSTAGMGPWWLIFPALVGLFWAQARRDTPFRDGWWFAFAYFTTTLYWIAYVVHVFGMVPAVVAWIPLVLLSAYSALYLGFALYCARLIPERWRWPALATAVVAFDVLRGLVFTGFPWTPWGSSLIESDLLALPVTLIGSHGLMWLLIAWCVAAADAVLYAEQPQQRRTAMRRLSTISLVWFMLLGAGANEREPAQTAAASDLNVGIVQGNLAQDVKWSPEMRKTTIQIYEDLTRRATAEGPLSLLVWPETSMPFFYQTPGAERTWVRRIVEQAQTPLLFGAPAFRFESGELRPSLFNRAYLLDQTGTTVDHYDKVHLVPFGEYVPLESVLFFVKKMVEGIGEFVPGNGRKVLHLEPLQLGVLICYEAIFPFEVAEFVAGGAKILVQITNDAWFGQTAAPEQHLSMTRMRALEMGVPVVRAANTGISAWIDPGGNVVERIDMGQRGYILANVQPGNPTMFVRIAGKLYVVWLSCGLLFAALAVRDLWIRRRDKQVESGTTNEDDGKRRT